MLITLKYYSHILWCSFEWFMWCWILSPNSLTTDASVFWPALELSIFHVAIHFFISDIAFLYRTSFYCNCGHSIRNKKPHKTNTRTCFNCYGRRITVFGNIITCDNSNITPHPYSFYPQTSIYLRCRWCSFKNVRSSIKISSLTLTLATHVWHDYIFEKIMRW